MEAAFGHEKLVRGVHDLPPAEVPDIEADVIVVNFDLPGSDGDAVGFLFVRVECAMHEPLYERVLADPTTTDQDHLCFVERATRTTLEVVGKDSCWSCRLSLVV